MKDEIVPLCRDVLLVCEELELLGGTEFSLDGCRLPSNASKRWSGTIAELQQKQEKLEGKVKQMLAEQVEADKKDESGQTAKARRDKQVKKLKQQAERIDKFLEENQAKPGRQYKEVKSNITDNESAMMPSPRGTIQGYNAQALVDAKHQVIVHGDAFGYGQDHTHIPPVLDGAKETMEALGHGKDYFEGATFSADTSYHSTINIKRCEEEKLDAYIPDRYFRARDPRFARQESDGLKKKKKFTLGDFHYDETADQYSCVEGQVLKSKGKRAKRGGTLYRKYAAEKKVCLRCVQRERCLKDKRAKRKWLAVPIGTESRNYSQEMAAKIDTEQGRKIYPRRIAIVEPVFANIRTQKRLDRFTLRGKIKVTIQWLLYCMVHNIEKIVNYGDALAEG
jgi:outer membrane murein-binding lipoprotein Lpp